MGVHIPAGFGQAILKFSALGVADQIVVTFGVQDGSAGTDNATAEAIATLLHDTNEKLCWGLNFSNAFTFLGVDYMRGNVEGTTVGTAPRSIGGLTTIAPLPVNCAILMKKSTSLGGRRGRGRMFWPPMHIAEGDISPNGNIDSARVASLQTKVGLLLTDLELADHAMYLLHSDETVPPTKVTQLTVTNKIATQRRRMR